MSKTKPVRRMSLVIMRAVAIGYIGLLILLLAVDIMVINSERRENRRILSEAVSALADRISSDTDAINQYLYNVYENDESFLRLGKEANAARSFSCAGDLSAKLSVYYSINKAVDGYFVIYGTDPRHAVSLGSTNPQVVVPDDKIRIEELIKNSLSQNRVHEELYFTPEDDCYQIMKYQSGHSSIAFVRNLSRLARELQNAWPELESVKITDDPDAWRSAGGRDDSRIVFMSRVSEGGPLLAARGSRRYLFRFSGLQIFLLAVTAVSFAGIVLLYNMIRRHMLQPMYRIVSTMEQLSRGEISDVPDIPVRYYEMQMMISSLRSTIRELRHREDSFYQEQLLRQETELQLAYTQLKPHFFLNCLKTLYILAVKSGSQQIQEIILMISDHLRYLINISRHIVPLREEMEFTRNYVDLQNALKSRKIELFSEVSEELSSVDVPLLCIQLFVENSVKYAQLDSDDAVLQIMVSVQPLESEGKRYMDIIVRDNGRGYPEEFLKAFNRKEEAFSRDREMFNRNDESSSPGTGVGILNIRHRCDLIYGPEAECILYNMDGAVGELILPLNPGAQEPRAASESENQ